MLVLENRSVGRAWLGAFAIWHGAGNTCRTDTYAADRQDGASWLADFAGGSSRRLGP